MTNTLPNIEDTYINQNIDQYHMTVQEQSVATIKQDGNKIEIHIRKTVFEGKPDELPYAKDKAELINPGNADTVTEKTIKGRIAEHFKPENIVEIMIEPPQKGESHPKNFYLHLNDKYFSEHIQFKTRVSHYLEPNLWDFQDIQKNIDKKIPELAKFAVELIQIMQPDFEINLEFTTPEWSEWEFPSNELNRRKYYRYIDKEGQGLKITYEESDDFIGEKGFVFDTISFEATGLDKDIFNSKESNPTPSLSLILSCTFGTTMGIQGNIPERFHEKMFKILEEKGSKLF
ncbi:hypothetical protein HOG48_00415 [Candidatus Peregrinibacteria bacterium]|nr:hypothetical protein [Candidatus Peregrinibacteria bacterium]